MTTQELIEKEVALIDEKNYLLNILEEAEETEEESESEAEAEEPEESAAAEETGTDEGE